jgi:hypothetical protein
MRVRAQTAPSTANSQAFCPAVYERAYLIRARHILKYSLALGSVERHNERLEWRRLRGGGRAVAHVSGRRLVAALFGLFVGIMIAACSSSGYCTSSSSSHSENAPSLQDLYATRLSKDYQSLDRGVLSYSPIRSLPTGTTVPFEVTVTDVGRGPQYAGSLPLAA